MMIKKGLSHMSDIIPSSAPWVDNRDSNWNSNPTDAMHSMADADMMRILEVNPMTYTAEERGEGRREEGR
jgi:hypothetical protein